MLSAQFDQMTDLSLTILPETADDAVPIERLHERAFGPIDDCMIATAWPARFRNGGGKGGDFERKTEGLLPKRSLFNTGMQ